MKPIPYGRHSISDEDIAAVTEVLRSDFLTQGSKIAEFEAVIAKLVGAKYAVAVSNGTAALHLAALALGVKPGTKVITTPTSFSATANCIRYCGGEVVFADIDPKTNLLSEEAVTKILESFPTGTFSGVIPVDMAGYPLPMDRWHALAEKHGLWIIEDACHALGAYFTDGKGTRTPAGSGQYADLGIFSFHPVKHIATGEGGMITTWDKDLYDKLLILRTHGITRDPKLMTENQGGWYYEMVDLGFNYRLTDIQAALGTSQAKRLSPWLERRKALALKYDEAFKETAVQPAPRPTHEGHAYHLYTIQVNNRKEVYDHLRSKNIFAQVHYIPIHLMPSYKELGWKKGDFPNAEKYYERCLSLPMFASLEDSEQDYVIKSVLEAAK